MIVLQITGFLVVLINGLHASREQKARDLAQSEARTRDAEGALLEARGRLLAAQLDPHVVFNSLVGVGELLEDDPKAARTMLYASVEYLRGLIVINRDSWTTLGQERKLVGDFLAVECFRFGDRLRVQWQWPESLDAIRIPPLIIQTLVENALNMASGLTDPVGPCFFLRSKMTRWSPCASPIQGSLSRAQAQMGPALALAT
jgi:LytS/YehU family sensor histidine kinase